MNPAGAAIARAMMETHDWITPRLWGTPWFEKPVLYYWTGGIAMRIFGVGEFAAKIAFGPRGIAQPFSRSPGPRYVLTAWVQPGSPR